MATKKQRKRRAKYEFVAVDDDGNEIAVAKAQTVAKASKPAPGKRAARPIREIKPPSWSRAVKWAGVFTAIMLVFSLQGKKGGAGPAVMVAIAYGAALIPGVYWMHRLQYRTYLRQRDRLSRR
jgi:hypothetical protein